MKLFYCGCYDSDLLCILFRWTFITRHYFPLVFLQITIYTKMVKFFSLHSSDVMSHFSTVIRKRLHILIQNIMLRIYEEKIYLIKSKVSYNYR